MSEIKRAGLDLDEVILDFNSMAVVRLNEKYRKAFTRTDITSFDWYRKLYGISESQFFDDLVSLGILADANPYEGAQEAVHRLMERGIEVSIVTSRGFLPKGSDLTSRWLARHDIPYDRLEIVEAGKTKSDYFESPVDIFVDDLLKNHQDMIRAGLSKRNIVISNSWNDPAKPEASDILHKLEYRTSLVELISEI